MINRDLFLISPCMYSFEHEEVSYPKHGFHVIRRIIIATYVLRKFHNNYNNISGAKTSRYQVKYYPVFTWKLGNNCSHSNLT